MPFFVQVAFVVITEVILPSTVMVCVPSFLQVKVTLHVSPSADQLNTGSP